MRLLTILRHLVPLTLSFLRDRRRWILFGHPLPRSASFHQARADRLLSAITDLGPSFVKIGQIFAGRADLLPEAYAHRLESLTDEVPPVPVAEVYRTIEESLHRPVSDVFSRFDPEPLAAGSLGQVHRAAHDGLEVAVKVLRPGVRELVAQDVHAARKILGVLTRFVEYPELRTFGNVVDEFAIRVKDEMDFRIEADNARAVRANFAGNPRIRVPRVIDAVSTDRVLVLEYVTGTRIDRLPPGLYQAPFPVSKVVERLIEVYIQMMLVDGFFHADPHPGNLLVDAEGTLVLLDFGVVIRVSRERRKQLVDTAFAAVQNRPEGVVDGFYALGIVEPGVERERIVRLVGVLLGLARTRTTAKERVELVTQQVMDELANWPIVLPSDLVYFARTAALIEGIGLRYDPAFNPILDAGPVLFRMRSKLLGAFAGASPLDQLDWAAAIGYFLGRATSFVREAGDRLAGYLAGLTGTAGAAPSGPEEKPTS